MQFLQEFSERKMKRLVEGVLLASFKNICIILKEEKKSNPTKKIAELFSWILSRGLSSVVLPQKDLFTFFHSRIFNSHANIISKQLQMVV